MWHSIAEDQSQPISVDLNQSQQILTISPILTISTNFNQSQPILNDLNQF